MNDMDEEPKPIILTRDSQTVSEEKNLNVALDPGGGSLALSLLFIFVGVAGIAALNELCCLVGLLCLGGGVVLFFRSISKTRVWKKEKDKSMTFVESMMIAILFTIIIPLLFFYLISY